MKFAKVFSYQIGDTTTTEILAKDCFKLKVRNDSPGPITVAGLVIEPQREETFDGLPPDTVFNENFELNAEEAGAPVIFITRYFYVDKKC
jgi:hypothetical protein